MHKSKTNYSFFGAHPRTITIFQSTIQVLVAIVTKYQLSSVEKLLRKPGEILYKYNLVIRIFLKENLLVSRKIEVLLI